MLIVGAVVAVMVWSFTYHAVKANVYDYGRNGWKPALWAMRVVTWAVIVVFGLMLLNEQATSIEQAPSWVGACIVAGIFIAAILYMKLDSIHDDLKKKL